jgi:hypothetical protein
VIPRLGLIISINHQVAQINATPGIFPWILPILPGGWFRGSKDKKENVPTKRDAHFSNSWRSRKYYFYILDFG